MVFYMGTEKGKKDRKDNGKLVVIACSTGGPKALHQVIPKLPSDLPVPVAVVQHMPPMFTAALAERLNESSDIVVKEAAEGEPLEAGTVYLAKGGSHLKVRSACGGSFFYYSDEEPREGVKPCANYLYESLVDCNYSEIICVVLTGMGADGTEGIRNLKKEKKVFVITQDEKTCTIYGMPKSVERSGLADRVVPLEAIAKEIIESTGVMSDGCKPIP